MRLFPNPSYGDLNLEYYGNSNATVTIMTVEGRVILQEKLVEGRNYLPLQQLNKGFYLARVKGDQDHIIKFILE